MAIKKVGIQIEVDTKTGEVRLRDFSRTVEDIAKKGGKGFDEAGAGVERFHRKLLPTNGLLREVATGFAAFKFAQYARGWLDVAASGERTTTMLTGITGSSERAKRSFDWMMRLRAPYGLEAIKDSFVKMEAVRLNNVTDKVKALTDAVSFFGGTDQTVQRASVAIQQIAGKGVVSMEELRQQLGEAIPTAMQVMAEKMGMSVRKLVKEIEKGNVDATTGLEAMFAGFEEKYGGASERMAKTWSGMWAMMGKEHDQFRIRVMESGPFEVLKKGLSSFLDKIDELKKNGQLDVWARDMAVGVVGSFRIMLGAAALFGNAVIGLGVLLEKNNEAFADIGKKLAKEEHDRLSDILSGRMDDYDLTAERGRLEEKYGSRRFVIADGKRMETGWMVEGKKRLKELTKEMSFYTDASEAARNTVLSLATLQDKMNKSWDDATAHLRAAALAQNALEDFRNRTPSEARFPHVSGDELTRRAREAEAESVRTENINKSAKTLFAGLNNLTEEQYKNLRKLYESDYEKFGQYAELKGLAHAALAEKIHQLNVKMVEDSVSSMLPSRDPLMRVKDMISVEDLQSERYKSSMGMIKRIEEQLESYFHDIDSRSTDQFTSDRLEAYRRLYDDLQGMAERNYQVEVSLLDRQLDQYKIFIKDEALLAQWYGNELQKIYDRAARSGDSFFAGAGAALRQLSRETLTWGEAGYQTVISFAGHADAALSDTLFAGLTGKIEDISDIWRSAWQGMLSDMTQIIGRMIREAAMEKIVIPIFYDLTGGLLGAGGNAGSLVSAGSWVAKLFGGSSGAGAQSGAWAGGGWAGATGDTAGAGATAAGAGVNWAALWAAAGPWVMAAAAAPIVLSVLEGLFGDRPKMRYVPELSMGYGERPVWPEVVEQGVPARTYTDYTNWDSTGTEEITVPASDWYKRGNANQEGWYLEFEQTVGDFVDAIRSGIEKWAREALPYDVFDTWVEKMADAQVTLFPGGAQGRSPEELLAGIGQSYWDEASRAMASSMFENLWNIQGGVSADARASRSVSDAYQGFNDLYTQYLPDGFTQEEILGLVEAFSSFQDTATEVTRFFKDMDRQILVSVGGISRYEQSVASMNDQFDSWYEQAEKYGAAAEKLTYIEEQRTAALERLAELERQSVAASQLSIIQRFDPDAYGSALVSSFAAKYNIDPAQVTEQNVSGWMAFLMDPANNQAIRDLGDALNIEWKDLFADIPEVANYFKTLRESMSLTVGMGGLASGYNSGQQAIYTAAGGTMSGWYQSQATSLYSRMAGGDYTQDDANSLLSLVGQWYGAAVSEAIAQAERMGQALEQAADSSRRMVDTIEQTVRGLRYGDLNVALPSAKFETASVDYASLFQRAMGGDEAAVQEFISFAPEFLRVAQDNFKSSLNYQTLFASVMADLDAVSAYVQSSGYQQAMVAQLTAQTTHLVDIAAAVAPVDATLNAVLTAIGLLPGGIGQYLANTTPPPVTNAGSALGPQSPSSPPTMSPMPMPSPVVTSGTLAHLQSIYGEHFHVDAARVLRDVTTPEPYAQQFGVTVAELRADMAAIVGMGGYREGGIATGPESGHIQLLHGTEAVIPLGRGELPLRVNAREIAQEIASALKKELAGSGGSGRPIQILIQLGPEEFEGYVRSQADHVRLEAVKRKQGSRRLYRS